MEGKSRKGQVLLIVLLVAAVGLVVVLSVVSRSITDISITTKEEEALRAFSAAEAGVEQALVGTVLTGKQSVGQDATFEHSVTSVAQGESSFLYPQDILAGDSATVWFVSHGSDGGLVCQNPDSPCFTGGQLRVCWGKQGTPNNLGTTPAIEASIVYLRTPGNYATVEVVRGSFDPNSDRIGTNKFSAVASGGCTIDENNFEFGTTLNFSDLGIPSSSTTVVNGLQFGRIRIFYNTDESQPIAFDVNFPGNSTLPSQGTRIDSVGVSGESTRKVEVLQGYPDLPPIFDNAIFTPSGITQ